MIKLRKILSKIPCAPQVASLIRILKIMRLKVKANLLARRSRVQYFVVPVGGKIRLISKPVFKQLRQKGVFPASFTAAELKNVALYYTPNRATLNFSASSKYPNSLNSLKCPNNPPSL